MTQADHSPRIDADQHESLQPALQRALSQAVQTLDARWALFALASEDYPSTPAILYQGLSQPQATGVLLKLDGQPGLSQLFEQPDPFVLPSQPSDTEADDPMAGHALLIVPLNLETTTLGFLVAGRDQSRPYDQLEQQRLAVIAARAAAAVEVQRAKEHTQRLASYQDLATRIGLLLASSHDLPTIQHKIVEEIGLLLDASYCGFLSYNEDYTEATIQPYYQKPDIPPPPRSFDPRTQFDGWPPTGKVAIIEDLASLAEKPPALAELAQRGIRSLLAVPLIIKGRLYGNLGINEHRYARRWTHEEQQLLQTVAAYVAASIENAALLEEQARRTETLEELQKMAQQLLAMLDQGEIFQIVIETIYRLLHADYVSVFLYEPDSGHLRLVAGHGWHEHEIGNVTIPLTEAFQSSYSFLHRQEVMSENLPQDPRFQITSRLSQYGVVSGLSVPLIVSEQGLGVLAIYYRQQHDFHKLDLHTLTLAAGQLATALEKARLFSEMQRLSEFNQALLQAQAAGVAMADKQGRLVFVNKHISEMLGSPENSFMGKPWHLFITPWDHSRVASELPVRIRAGAAQYETSLLASSGEEIPVLISARPVREGNEIIGALATLTDLRERKRSEAQLEQLSRVIETMIEGMLILSPRGVITYANKTAAAMLNTSVDQLIGRSVRSLGTLEDQQLPSLLSILKAARREGWSGEMTLRRPDRALVHLAVSLIVMRNPRGQAEAYATLIRDLSQVKVLQQQLIQSERLNAIGSLVAGVAHEINNPLTSIYGYLDLALLENELPSEIRPDLLAARGEAARAARIVRNLLTFARQHSTQRQEVDINDILLQTIELRAYHFRTDQITLQLNLDSALPLITADGPRLQQVFFNLITNAHQALSAWRGRRELEITTEQLYHHVRITIADSGPGIPADALPHIFEPFFTTKPLGEGTGLGLSIAHGIVEEHGGSIWAEARPGYGVSFTVELPQSSEQNANTPAADDQQETWIYQGSALVIDDEPGVLNVLTRMLQHCGLEVEGLADARQALAILERGFVYDLIFCDIRLQGMSGIEFYHEMHERFPALLERLVFISGDTMNEEMTAFVTASGRPSQQKPFNLSDMLSLVGQMLSPANR